MVCGSVQVAGVGGPGFGSSVEVGELEDEGLGWASAFASSAAGFAGEVVLPPCPLLTLILVPQSTSLKDPVDAELACYPVSEITCGSTPRTT